MSLRAAAVQLGTLIGAATGGLAFGVGGAGALGVVLGLLFLLAPLPLYRLGRRRHPMKHPVPRLRSAVAVNR